MRTKRNLSAIINFGKWREEKLQVFTDLQDRQEQVRADHAAAAEENARLRAELEAMRAERARGDQEAAGIEAEREQLLLRIPALNESKEAVGAQLKGLKKRVAGLTQDLADRKKEISEAESRRAGLEDLVVQSPERLKASLAQREARLEEERARTAAAEKRHRDAASRAEALQRYERDLSGAVQALEALDQQIGKKKDVSRRVKELKAQIDALEDEALHLQATRHQLRRQEGALVERMERLTTQAAMKRDAVQFSVQQQKASKDAVEAANSAAEERKQENEARARALREQIRNREQQHEAQVKTMLDKYEAMMSQTRAYKDGMLQAMKMPDEVTGGHQTFV